MTEGADSKPIALLENPAKYDAESSERVLKKEVKNANPIELGDVLMERHEVYRKGQLESTGISLQLATFKPEDVPENLMADRFPYPISRTGYINSLTLLVIYGDDENLKINRNHIGNLYSQEIGYELDDLEHKNPPVKSVYFENYHTAVHKNSKLIPLSRPVICEKYEIKILNPESDLPPLTLNFSESSELLANARQARYYLADNLLDQPPQESGLTDLRLHQIDNLINYLSIQVGFSNSKRL